MSDRIQVNLSFVREDTDGHILEDYSHTFSHSDENSYDGILENVQTMLQAIGYEFSSKSIMAVDPKELVTDCNPVLHPFSVVRNPDYG